MSSTSNTNSIRHSTVPIPQTNDKDALTEDMLRVGFEIFVRDREVAPDFCFNRALQWITARDKVLAGATTKN